mgnify:FL=1
MRYVILSADQASCCITAAFESNGDWSLSHIHEPKNDDGSPLDMASVDAVTRYVHEYCERYYPTTTPDNSAVITDESFVWTQVDLLRQSHQELGAKERELVAAVFDLATSLWEAREDLNRTVREMHVLCRTPWWTQWWWWLCGWPENRIVDKPTPRLWHNVWMLIRGTKS